MAASSKIKFDEERSAITKEFETQATQAEQEDDWALVILWSAREPERVGEVALLGHSSEPWILGRCPEAPQALQALTQDASGIGKPVTFFRQRPAAAPSGGSPEEGSSFLLGMGISRRQLLITPRTEGLELQNVGRCPLLINGQAVASGLAPLGATIHLKDQLLLFCTARPRVLPALKNFPLRCIHRFGEPDTFGLVGEGPAMWTLRDRAALLAQSMSNVLIVGESGTGKELAAHLIHGLSIRSNKQLVSTNIAAIASGLATVQLFGNRKGFPETKMPESKGLVGAADGSCLFLDEIGDMPLDVQPMFLRVTDEGREYHRLGEEDRPPRSSDFRLLGATNRPEQLRIELKRRFPRSLQVPTLQERREDIPLLVRYNLLQLKRKGDCEVERFFLGDEPQLHPLLIEYLIHHPYKTHVAEISILLGQAMAKSRGGVIMPCSSWLTPETRLETKLEPRLEAAGASAVSGPAIPLPPLPLIPAAAPAASFDPPPQPASELPSGEDRIETVRALVARIKKLSAEEQLLLRNLIEYAYQQCRGDHKKAAALLGLDRYKLYRLLRRVGWQPVRSMSLSS